MSRVELTGWIPVTVVVDLEDECVAEVHAWDEEFRYGDPPSDLPAWQPADDDERTAREIADEAIWPAWEWGA